MSKKLFLSGIVLFVLLSSSLNVLVVAQSSWVEWSQTYGGPSSDSAKIIVQTSDGGFVLVGSTTSFGTGDSDFWLIKTDGNGNMQWNQTIGGLNHEIVSSLVVTSDGGYAMTGRTSSTAIEESDFLLVKTDAFGNLEWNQTYGGTWYESASSLVETSDGGYALAGRTWDYGGSEVVDFWMVKTDAIGNMEWNQTYGTKNIEDSNSLVETSDGGYVIAGDTSDPISGGGDFWLVRTDRNGIMLWNQTIGGPKHERDSSLVVTSDGGFAIVGIMVSGIDNNDLLLVKTDALGSPVWNQTYGGANNEGAGSLVETSDGGYAIAGYTASFGAGRNDFWLIKTDSNGNMQWNQTYGGEDHESANSLVETSDGGFVLFGGTISFGVGDSDFWLVRTDEFGIPEFPSWIILPLVVSATLAIIISRKRLTKSRKLS